MKGSHLGEFEELVMLMVALLNDEAYGIRIVEEIKDKMDRKVILSAVHVTLYRLEDKGLVKSAMGGATGERGGRRKRIFSLTKAGYRALQDAKDQKTQLWQLIPKIS